jgi:hypothetical protein
MGTSVNEVDEISCLNKIVGALATSVADSEGRGVPLAFAMSTTNVIRLAVKMTLKILR